MIKKHILFSFDNEIGNIFRKKRNHLKNHKLRNINTINKSLTEENINSYKDLTYELYKVKMNDFTDLETISKLEFKMSEYANKHNIGNVEKIDATLEALERYYDELKKEENIAFPKRRGITIYEDLSYKLHKLKNNNPINKEQINKIENKLNECKEKYQLTELEQIDSKIKSLEKYNQLLLRKEENKKIGMNTYKTLIKDLYNLKQERIINISKITEMESKIKKCSNKYNLTNLDKINIQLNILEKI